MSWLRAFWAESWLQASFHSWLVHRFVAIGLEKMKCYFEIGGEIVSSSNFVIVVWAHAYSFPKLIVSILDWWNWVWILKILWTRWIRRTSWLKIGLLGGESPLTLWRVEIILETMVIRLGAWVILIRIRPVRHTMLVKAMICWVGNIQKRGWYVIWITIKIEKIIVISHITQ